MTELQFWLSRPVIFFGKCVESRSSRSGSARTKSISEIGSRQGLKPRLRHFTYISPNIYSGQGRFYLQNSGGRQCLPSLPLSSPVPTLFPPLPLLSPHPLFPPPNTDRRSVGALWAPPVDPGGARSRRGFWRILSWKSRCWWQLYCRILEILRWKIMKKVTHKLNFCLQIYKCMAMYSRNKH